MEGANLMQSPIVKALITCEVCNKFLIDPRVLPCQHSFCLNCLDTLHQLRQADSHIKLGSLRCPTCRTIAAIPLGGLEHFPADKKVEKVRELVDELLIQSIISKSVSDSRTSLNSFQDDRDDHVYGSRTSMYSSTTSVGGTPKVTNQTQTDVSWEDLSQAAVQTNGRGDSTSTAESTSESSTLPKSSPNRRRRRRPKPAEDTMENELFISEEPPTPKVNGMKDIPEQEEVTSPKEQNCDVAENNAAEVTEQQTEETNEVPSQNGEPTEGTEEEAQEKEDPVKENVIYEISEHVWEAAGYDYNMPTSMAFLSDGTAVVAEYGNSHLQFFSPDGKFQKAVEELKPFCLCVDNEDRILVGDRRDKTLRMFDSDGEQIMTWDLDLFKWISGIGVTSGWKYVICEREKCKIGIYEPEGQLIKEFGSNGHNDTQFSMADFLAIDSHDRIVLCDSANHCVKLFDTNGKFLRKFGERGNRNGQLEWPKSVCLDHQDNVIVTDKQNNRVCMFSPDGEFIQHMILDYPQPYAVAFQEGDPNHFGVTHYDLKGQSTISVFALKDKAPATED